MAAKTKTIGKTSGVSKNYEESLLKPFKFPDPVSPGSNTEVSSLKRNEAVLRSGLITARPILQRKFKQIDFTTCTKSFVPFVESNYYKIFEKVDFDYLVKMASSAEIGVVSIPNWRLGTASYLTSMRRNAESAKNGMRNELASVIFAVQTFAVMFGYYKGGRFIDSFDSASNVLGLSGNGTLSQVSPGSGEKRSELLSKLNDLTEKLDELQVSFKSEFTLIKDDVLDACAAVVDSCVEIANLFNQEDLLTENYILLHCWCNVIKFASQFLKTGVSATEVEVNQSIELPEFLDESTAISFIPTLTEAIMQAKYAEDVIKLQSVDFDTIFCKNGDGLSVDSACTERLLAQFVSGMASCLIKYQKRARDQKKMIAALPDYLLSRLVQSVWERDSKLNEDERLALGLLFPSKSPSYSYRIEPTQANETVKSFSDNWLLEFKDFCQLIKSCYSLDDDDRWWHSWSSIKCYVNGTERVVRMTQKKNKVQQCRLRNPFWQS